MKYSEHALERKNERSIDAMVVELVMSYGAAQHDHDGCIFTSLLNRKRRQKIAKHLRKIAESIERENPIFLVEATDGTIVTVGRQYKRHRRH